MTAHPSSRPLQGTLYGANGDVLREGTDPRMAQALSLLGALPGGYIGARTDRRALQEWTPLASSPDAASIGDLPTLRARSEDLLRNAPLAAGAVNTLVTNAIGGGLRPKPSVDTDYLSFEYGVSEDQADAFERGAARLWRFHSSRRQFDVAGLDTHEQLQDKALRAVLGGGDVFGLRRYKPDRAGGLFGHCVQLIEASLVSNPETQLDREGFAGGIETDADGGQLAIHVASRYEWDLNGLEARRWNRVPVFGAASGERIVRHLAWRRRIKQSRGVPYLALVIEPLKQLDRYGEAELMAAVIASMFTIFIKSDFAGEFGLDVQSAMQAALHPKAVGEGVPVPRKVRMASGGVVQLLPGEDISIADPKRPSQQYDPFVLSKLGEIGSALEIPQELLVKRFMASYSAARGSRLEFWKFCAPVRSWIAADFCQPDYEALLEEAVTLGYLEAPGFLEDPLARDAWCRCRWIGPAPGQIDELKEVSAAKLRIEANLSTREAETAALTGGDFEQDQRQRTKERRLIGETGADATDVLSLDERDNDEADRAEEALTHA